MKKALKFLLGLFISILFIVIAFFAFLYFGSFWSRPASEFTEEEHLQRISERIQKKYIDGDRMIRKYDDPNALVKATGFEVYPLYDENEELEYALVEFQPYGYLYVYIGEESLKAFTYLGVSTSMYSLSSTGGEKAWTPCTLNEEKNGVIWETDDNNEKILYYNSPFYVRNINDERRYMIYFKDCSGSSEYIPAVKRNGKFINLYSESEIDFQNGQITGAQAVAIYVQFIKDKSFDL